MFKRPSNLRQALTGILKLCLVVFAIFSLLFGILPTFNMYYAFSNALGMSLEQFSIFISSVASIAVAAVAFFALDVSKDLPIFQHMYPKLIIRRRSGESSTQDIIIKNIGSDVALNVEIQIFHPLATDGFTYEIDILEPMEEHVIRSDNLERLVTFPIKLNSIRFKLNFLNYFGRSMRREYSVKLW